MPEEGELEERRKKIDATLARFSAVHDEMADIERAERERWGHLTKFIKRTGAKDKGEADAPKAPIPGGGGPGKPGGAKPRGIAASSPRRRQVLLAVKIATVAVAGAVFAATGFGWVTKLWVDDQFREIAALDPDSKDIQQKEKQYGAANFLILGSDTRAGATAEDSVGDESAVAKARSDTIMIAHVPANRSRVVLVSFPRDLEINRPECQSFDHKTGQYTNEKSPTVKAAKLNTTYSFGGPKCVTKVIQQLSGLNITNFVGIDFPGFKAMVDAVDGVEVCVQRPMIDDELGKVLDNAGKHKISGDKALEFVRARKVEGDPTADYGRIKRQQRFLSSLMRKALSNQVLLDPGKLQDFVQAVARSTFGDNIGVDQLVTLAQSLQSLDPARVTFVTVPTVGGANRRGNEELRQEDTEALFTAIIEGRPLPGEAPVKPNTNSPAPQAQAVPDANQPAGQLVDPSKVKIQVLNGSGKDSAASKAATALSKLGFAVVRQGNATQQSGKTIIRYARERLDQAQTLKAAVPSAWLLEEPSMGGAIELLIGTEFDGKVVPPQQGANSQPGIQGPPPDQLPKNLSTINGADVSCA